MFEDFTINQLIELRSFCADMIERANGLQNRADTLLLLEHIDQELTTREQKKSA